MTKTCRQTRSLWMWLIPALILLCGAALLSRNVIRAHWWAHRLASADSAPQRLVYLQRLISLGDHAAPAVAGWLADDDVALRSMAVAVLHHARSERALRFILKACEDPDVDVRRLAIKGLAIRGDPRAVEELARIVGAADERTGMIAAAALGMIGSDRAGQALVDLVRSSLHPGVRIEAIDALAALGFHQAVEILREAVTDTAVFRGMTESDANASRMFQGAKARLAPEGDLSAGASLGMARHHSVAEQARQALRALNEPSGSETD